MKIFFIFLLKKYQQTIKMQITQHAFMSCYTLVISGDWTLRGGNNSFFESLKISTESQNSLKRIHFSSIDIFDYIQWGPS